MNPSIYELYPDDEQILLVATAFARSADEIKDTLRLIETKFNNKERLFASYYRPGEFWDHEVFVCPQCKHATLEEPPLDKWKQKSYCEYCYTDWYHDQVKGYIQIQK